MDELRQLLRPGRALFLGIAALLGVPALSAGARGADPVEELQKALAVRAKEALNPSEQFYRFREETLRRKIADLKTVGQLRRALSLKDWKDEAGGVDDKALQQIDARMRKLVADRFTQSIRTVI